VKKIKELNALAAEMVGDDKSPNLYFVTQKGDVVTVTRHFEKAHQEWLRLVYQHIESVLEDRQTGIICSVGMEPRYNDEADDFTGPEAWTVRDDSVMFKFRKKDGSYK